MNWNNITTNGGLPKKHRFVQQTDEELRNHIMSRLSDLLDAFAEGSEINLVSSWRADWRRYPHTHRWTTPDGHEYSRRLDLGDAKEVIMRRLLNKDFAVGYSLRGVEYVRAIVIGWDWRMQPGLPMISSADFPRLRNSRLWNELHDMGIHPLVWYSGHRSIYLGFPFSQPLVFNDALKLVANNSRLWDLMTGWDSVDHNLGNGVRLPFSYHHHTHLMARFDGCESFTENLYALESLVEHKVETHALCRFIDARSKPGKPRKAYSQDIENIGPTELLDTYRYKGEGGASNGPIALISDAPQKDHFTAHNSSQTKRKNARPVQGLGKQTRNSEQPTNARIYRHFSQAEATEYEFVLEHGFPSAGSTQYLSGNDRRFFFYCLLRFGRKDEVRSLLIDLAPLNARDPATIKDRIRRIKHALDHAYAHWVDTPSYRSSIPIDFYSRFAEWKIGVGDEKLDLRRKKRLLKAGELAFRLLVENKGSAVIAVADVQRKLKASLTTAIDLLRQLQARGLIEIERKHRPPKRYKTVGKGWAVVDLTIAGRARRFRWGKIFKTTSTSIAENEICPTVNDMGALANEHPIEDLMPDNCRVNCTDHEKHEDPQCDLKITDGK